MLEFALNHFFQSLIVFNTHIFQILKIHLKALRYAESKINRSLACPI